MEYQEYAKNYNEIYQNNLQKSIWPWSDLVSKVMNIRKELPENFNVLELGCGQGANISFFEQLGANYYSIEGSEYSVEVLKSSFPKYAKNICTGNFIEPKFDGVKFDLIADRASLTCNRSSAIKKCLKNLVPMLAKKSFFVGIDWYSLKHDEYPKGMKDPSDPFFVTFSPETSFFQPPQMHFSDESHIKDLFSDYDFLHLEEKVTNHFAKIREIPHQLATWNFIAQRRV